MPLGVLVEIGYAVRWEWQNFELTDRAGCIVDAKLEGSCPTVDEELGLELIKEIETYHLEKRARLAVLTGLREHRELGQWLRQGAGRVEEDVPGNHV